MYCVTLSATGIVVDLIEYIGNLYNFTYVIDKDNSGRWGDLDFQFDNLYAESNLLENFIFIDNNYDSILIEWRYKRDRIPYVDFLWPMKTLQHSLVYNANTMDTRGDVLLKPFKNSTWFFISAILSIGCIVLFSFSALEKNLLINMTFPRRITTLTLWFFFVIISAYYSGSLTMFFADGSGLPFNSLAEGLDYYPKWKLTLPQGKRRMNDSCKMIQKFYFRCLYT